MTTTTTTSPAPSRRRGRVKWERVARYAAAVLIVAAVIAGFILFPSTDTHVVEKPTDPPPSTGGEWAERLAAAEEAAATANETAEQAKQIANTAQGTANEVAKAVETTNGVVTEAAEAVARLTGVVNGLVEKTSNMATKDEVEAHRVETAGKLEDLTGKVTMVAGLADQSVSEIANLKGRFDGFRVRLDNMAAGVEVVREELTARIVAIEAALASKPEPAEPAEVAKPAEAGEVAEVAEVAPPPEEEPPPIELPPTDAVLWLDRIAAACPLTAGDLTLADLEDKNEEWVEDFIARCSSLPPPVAEPPPAEEVTIVRPLSPDEMQIFFRADARWRRR